MSKSSPPATAEKLKIILIDDDASVSFALQLLLNAIGYDVEVYQNGQLALDAIANGCECDVVLSDLRMPIIDGLGVIKGVKATRPELPVVLMSAHASSAERQEAQALGSSVFLAKPFTPDQMHDVIEMVGLSPARVASN